MEKFFAYGILALLILPFFAFAQLEQTLIEQNLDAVVTPEVPESNTDTSIRVESYLTDLSRAEISWFLNEKLISRGTGLKDFSFRTSNAGTLSVVDVRIKTAENRLITRTFEFRPAEVNIVWEAVGYTPPFYKGKTIFATNGVLRVTALPTIISRGVTINPSNLVYKWEKNGEASGPLSGYGKNTITLDSGRLPEDTVIKVEVTTLDQSIRAKKTITISPSNPSLVLYEDHPLYGLLLNKALKGSHHLSAEEMTIRAVPYFFSSRPESTELIFDWRVDGRTVGNPKDPTITLRPEAGGAGSAQLSVGARDTARLFQRGDTSLSVSFGAKNNTTGVFDFFR